MVQVALVLVYRVGSLTPLWASWHVVKAGLHVRRKHKPKGKHKHKVVYTCDKHKHKVTYAGAVN